MLNNGVGTLHFPRWISFSAERSVYEFDEPINIASRRGDHLLRAIVEYLKRKEARIVRLVLLRKTSRLICY